MKRVKLKGNVSPKDLTPATVLQPSVSESHAEAQVRELAYQHRPMAESIVGCMARIEWTGAHLFKGVAYIDKTREVVMSMRPGLTSDEDWVEVARLSPDEMAVMHFDAWGNDEVRDGQPGIPMWAVLDGLHKKAFPNFASDADIAALDWDSDVADGENRDGWEKDDVKFSVAFYSGGLEAKQKRPVWDAHLDPNGCSKSYGMACYTTEKGRRFTTIGNIIMCRMWEYDEDEYDDDEDDE